MSYELLNRWYRSPLFWELFFIDRITKMIAYSLFFHRPWVINRFIAFDCSFNKGIAWSLFACSGTVGYALITLATLLLLIVIAKYTSDRQAQGYSVTGETLLLSGGLSNFVDRLMQRGVVDFIKISYGPWTFPIFNVADIAITLGGCIILYQFFFDE
ncbi:MAG: signal peptidase II [Proteobacteria bacterium]|nr:signal peptidase II [Pseudomonadota bacterium]